MEYCLERGPAHAGAAHDGDGGGVDQGSCTGRRDDMSWDTLAVTRARGLAPCRQVAGRRRRWTNWYVRHAGTNGVGKMKRKRMHGRRASRRRRPGRQSPTLGGEACLDNHLRPGDAGEASCSRGRRDDAVRRGGSPRHEEPAIQREDERHRCRAEVDGRHEDAGGHGRSEPRRWRRGSLKPGKGTLRRTLLHILIIASAPGLDGGCSRTVEGGGGTLRQTGECELMPPAGRWHGKVNGTATCYTDGARVGEASHPGPGPPPMPEVARRIPTGEGSSVIAYPKPGERSLGNVMAPGFNATARSCVDDGGFQLIVETVNSTGWAALKKRLAGTDAHAVLAQDTWVLQSAIPGASAWAKRHGWRSIWSPAIATKRGGTAAGVAIFVRDFMGLHHPEGRPHVIYPARAVAGVMEAPGSRPVVLISCYLKHGCGAAGINAEVLAGMGATVQALCPDGVCIMGGDYNMEPHELLATELDRTIDATIIHAANPRGTFRTVKTCSMIDYFMVSDRLAAAIESVSTVEASGVRGHTPVQLKFRPKLASLKALHLRQPPKIELERVYGPIPPPPTWDAQKALAAAALGAARAETTSWRRRMPHGPTSPRKN